MSSPWSLVGRVLGISLVKKSWCRGLFGCTSSPWSLVETILDISEVLKGKSIVTRRGKGWV